jgi:hypothetical protein
MYGIYFLGKILSRLGVTIRRAMDWMIGIFDTLYTPPGTSGNYSAITDLHTLQFNDIQTSFLSLLQFPMSVSWQRLLTQELYQSDCNWTLQISLYYRTHTDFSSLPDFQLLTELSRFLHRLPTANSGTLSPNLCCNCQLSRCHLFSVIFDCQFY